MDGGGGRVWEGRDREIGRDRERQGETGKDREIDRHG
jgi:hypothetical protein